jgi:uncharacterized cupredoxin-like copper-binding protein
MVNKAEQSFPMETSARLPAAAETAAAQSLAVGDGLTAGVACAALRRGRGDVLVDEPALRLGTWAVGYVGWLPAPGPVVVLLAVLLAGLLSGTVTARPVSAGEKPVAVVEVRVFEHRIEMLATVPPGATTFMVTNAGTMEHNFEVESQDLEKKFDSNLKPGETKNLQVDLAPGKYTVYCPVENHKALGMQLELTVAEQRTD